MTQLSNRERKERRRQTEQEVKAGKLTPEQAQPLLDALKPTQTIRE